MVGADVNPRLADILINSLISLQCLRGIIEKLYEEKRVPSAASNIKSRDYLQTNKIIDRSIGQSVRDAFGES